MKKLIFFGLLAWIGIQCKSETLDPSMSPVTGCISAQPTLIGRWMMTEFRYFGGCCPVISDTSWKKVPANEYIIEFTEDNKVKVFNAVAGMYGLTPASPAQLTTNFMPDSKTVMLDEQILGGVTTEKKVTIVKLTTRELVLAIPVGKEGETNERRFVRMCP